MNRDQRNRILLGAQRRRPIDIRDELGDMSLGELRRFKIDTTLLSVVVEKEIDFREGIEAMRFGAWQVVHGRDW